MNRQVECTSCGVAYTALCIDLYPGCTLIVSGCLYTETLTSPTYATCLCCVYVQVGLELSSTLRNLGVIADFTVGQQVSRVKGHSRLWDPRITSIDSSDEAVGYPAMYITLHLNWDKYKPLYSSAQLAAAPAAARGSPQKHIAHSGFTPPMSLNSPTPERVKIISKPSHQRWMGVQQLLRLRAASPPGIYLLSTHQGIITDIDAELRGVGGVVLAHLGLPLGHVVQLRGLLRSKHDAELADAGRRQQQEQVQPQSASIGSSSCLGPVQHVPLAQWDARQVAGTIVENRLRANDGRQDANAFLNALDQLDEMRAAVSVEATEKANQLQLQELAWTQKQRAGPAGADSYVKRGSPYGRRLRHAS